MSILEGAESGRYTVTASCVGEVFASPSSSGIELRIPVQFAIACAADSGLQMVSGVEMDPESQVDISKLPSVILHYTEAGESIWQMAKRHHSTRELILAANELDSAYEPQAGRLLIIPKKR